ncbi:MAG TPA: hypothetical protein VJ063_12250 [Verrucomicrobiae bacterium]|nr:hypothetical protein [Verrucomicrobiae bacterium]
MMKSWWVLFFSAILGHCQPVWLTGVNLAGAEFGENTLPGTYNQNYIYPTSSEVDYFLSTKPFFPASPMICEFNGQNAAS